jgi:speckle-type POZ protein
VSKKDKKTGPETQTRTTMLGSSVQFRIDYEQTKQLPIGKAILSDVFSVGGYNWRIECYPRGAHKEHKGEHLSIFLKHMGRTKRVKAIFEAFLMDKDGAPASSNASRCVKVYPPEGHISWGWFRFVTRRELEARHVVNGWATIVFGIIVVRDDPLAIPPSDIGDHLGRLLDCQDGSDVSFNVDGRKFAAHRAVLAARSPVFKAELFGAMAEATMSQITLEDINPAAFEVLLRFMYTDVLPPDGELARSPVEMYRHLLAAADRYAMDRLKLICADKLWQNVSVDTVAATVNCAETYNCRELKDKCMAFFVEEQNFKKIVLTDGYVQLVQKFPSIMAELREKVGA